MIVPVILAGGSGTRLWPLSRQLYPKQFLPLVNGRTLFQETVLRWSGNPDIASPIVACNEDHRLGNFRKSDLDLIEVQTGSSLGEDDIVRFDDMYGHQGEKEFS